MTRQLDCVLVHSNSSVIYQGLRSKFSAVETPTWALLLAESLRAVGHGAEILDCDAFDLTDEEAIECIRAYNPRFAVFVVMGSEPNQGTTRMASAVPLAEKLKTAHPEIKIVFVGSHTQALPKEVLSLPCVDFICQNEGVYTLRQLLDKDAIYSLVTGLGYKTDRGIHLNSYNAIVEQAVMNRDLPGYAWDLLPDLNNYRSHFWHAGYIHEKRSPFAAIYSSLGCPFTCSFCWVEGTKAVVANGKNKKVEDITLTDSLVAYDEKTGEVAETKIQAISSRDVDGFYRITLSNNIILELTGEHPLYSDGKWIDAKEATIGTGLLVIDKYDKVSLNKKLCNPMKRADVVAKMSATTKNRIASGDITPYMCTEEGRRTMSEMAKEKQSGPENPMKNKEVVAKFIATRQKRMEKGVPYHTPEELQRRSERMRGDKHHNWRDGSSKILHPREFSSSLKSFIRRRDKYTCQVCEFFGKGGRKVTGRSMHVHHIDYDKKNNTKCNLLLLCSSCHMKTNYNREEWQGRLTQKMLDLGHEGCPHYVKVVSNIFISKRVKVYNFQCAPYENYFANYVLGHNCMINLVNRTNNEDGITAADSAKFRYWTAEHTLKQIETLVNMGVTTIRFSDEMFALNPRHYEPILLGIRERWGDTLNLWAYARVDTVRQKHLELFRSAGIKWLCLGIESGVKDVRHAASKGSFADVDVRQVVKQIEDAGIDVISNVIFGLVGDTIATMEQTLALAIELNTSMFNCYPAMALPGSPLYAKDKKEGKPLPETFEAFGFLSYESTPSGTDTLSPAEVLAFRDSAFQKYWSRPEFLSKIASKWGETARTNIEEMLKMRLRRKILGDPRDGEVQCEGNDPSQWHRP